MPDDMGDDEQQTETELYERYIEDPPEHLDIDEPEEGELSISEEAAEELRPGERPDDGEWPPEGAEDGSIGAQ